ncbi:MAG: thioredoxin [Myxococcales bacterium]|nr:thioredoxin [Myxococcales bacterium]|tara:strand:- start:519 stop:848 length:330 start_codon:yes stop_codon:yes gene_type:complete
MSENTIDLTDANFQSEVLESSEPVLVDFWAPWCAPCRALTPTVDALATDFAGKVKVGKMNIDENPGTPGSLGVRSIPTLVMFKGGRPVDQVVGAVAKSKLEEMMNKQVG